MGAVSPESSDPGGCRCFSTRTIARRNLSPKVFELTLLKPTEFKFTPGQRVRFKHGRVCRDYSIASAPAEETIRLCIRKAKRGLLSPQLADAPESTSWTFTGPHGYFTFKASQRPAVFVATGTGIAPFCSMAASGIFGFTLLHGVEQAEDLYYRDLFQTRAAAYIGCLSGACPECIAHHPGRVTGYIETRLPRRAYDFYLCGRQDMIRDVTLLIDEIFQGSFVYSEVFY
jgi:ferredoxin-NADP reductase